MREMPDLLCFKCDSLAEFVKNWLITAPLLLGTFSCAAHAGPGNELLFADGFENHAPAITSFPGFIGEIDTPYVYDANATDFNGDLLAYALTAAPAGMSINALTGEISWTPDTGGAYSVELQVTDGNGGADVQSWAISVLSPIDCPGFSVESATGLPFSKIPIGNLPEEMQAPLAVLIGWEGGEETAISFVERALDDSVTMVVPLHPAGFLEGGTVSLRPIDGVHICPLISFEIEPLPEAPGEFSEIVSLMQELIGIQAALVGTTAEQLRQANVPLLPDYLLPLVILQSVVDHPANPNSLARIAAGTAPVVSGLGGDLGALDRVLGVTGFKADLAVVVANARPPALPAVAAEGPQGGNAVDCLTLPIELPAQLDQCMELAHSATFRLQGMSNKVLNDVSLALGVAGLVPSAPVKLASAGASLMIWAYQKYEEGTANLLPSEFVSLVVLAGPDSFLEDQEGPGYWAAEVIAKSKGWGLDQLVLEAILQTTLASEAYGGWLKRYADPNFLSDLLALVRNLVVQEAINTTAGSDFIEIAPENFGPVDISDEEWTEQNILAGDSVELTVHNEYEPRRPGQSLLDVRTVPGKFGGAQIDTDPNILLEVHQILMDFLKDNVVVTTAVVADSSEVFPLKLRVRNSKYPQMVAVVDPGMLAGSVGPLSYDGDIVDGGVHSVTYTAPANLGQLPDLLVSEHLAMTGARAMSLATRLAVVAFTPGAVTILASSACLQPGADRDLQATVEPEGQAVNWSIVSGGGSLNMNSGPNVTYTAPGSPATVTVRAELASNPDVFDEISFDVAECFGMTVWYQHQAAIWFPGEISGVGECTNADIDDESVDETLSMFVEPPALPPPGSYWQNQSSAVMFALSDEDTRRFDRDDPGCDEQSFMATAGLNAVLQSNLAGNRLDVNIAADTMSQCAVVGNNPEVICSEASAATVWEALYYIDLAEPASFDFTMELNCAGPDVAPFTDNVLVLISRFQGGTDPVPNNGGDGTNDILPIFADCYAGSPVSVDLTWDFVGPLMAGENDLIIVHVLGSRDAFVPTAEFPNLPAPGNHDVSTTMQGFFSLEPSE